MGLLNYTTKAQLYEAVDGIRSRLNISFANYPIDPFDIADICGDKLDLEYHFFNSNKIGGLLVKNDWPQASCIVLNARKEPQAQRFDCAHELIHYFLHPTNRRYMCETLKSQCSPFEYQANEGAAELLMPYKLFIPELLSLCDEGLVKNQVLEYLSKRYGLSRTAISYRINGLSYEIGQVMRGQSLNELHISSRSRQRRKGIASYDFESIAEQARAKASLRQNKLLFEYEEYEDELSRSGLYKTYYNGH